MSKRAASTLVTTPRYFFLYEDDGYVLTLLARMIVLFRLLVRTTDVLDETVNSGLFCFVFFT